MSAPPCRRCGLPLPGGARFCPSCGAPIADEAGAERKVVTMVFADLVGSTELSVGRDPEELRGLLARYFDAARGVLEEHGGTVEKFIGDAVLAVFGAPVAHGDDPDRAIAAALALVERVEALGDGLAVRVGVNTGDVLFTGSGSDLSVAGEAVNVAARLEQAAAPGEVLVGERTAHAARLARLAPTSPIEAKGIPVPVAAWRALAGEGPHPGVATRLVGRDDDLELLELVYRRAVRERLPQLVTIMGDAGIGKTRLASELLDGLRTHPDAPGVLVGRNPPYGRGIAFWALAEILRAAAGVDAGAPADAVRAGLTDRLAAAGAEDAEQIAGTLTLALGGGEDGDDRPEVAEALPRAWRRLVGLLAAERPLALAIDDAHWADDGLLELVETITHGLQDAPVLVLCTARPELLDRRPDWGRSARNSTLLELTPLRGEAAAALAEAVLGADAGGSAAAIAAAGAGNPFFVEEIARGLAQGGAAADGSLPDTVQAAIAARIDLLPPAEKRALRTAAVLGETFSEIGLRQLLEDEPSSALQELARRELVQERAAEGAGVYRFRHQLVRDVAYESLPRAERSGLHERAASWLDESGTDRYSEVAEIVAFHRRQASELAPSAERRRLAHAALRAAAASARGRGATGRAQELYEQAAELSESASERADDLGIAARVALDRFLGDTALALFRAAAAAKREAGDEVGALRETAWALQVGARNPGLMASPVDPGELLAEVDAALARVPAGDDELCGRLLATRVFARWRRQEAERARGDAERAVEFARRTPDADLLSTTLDALTAVEIDAGDFAAAARITRDRARLIPRLRTPDERADVFHMLVENLVAEGAFHEAAGYAEEGLRYELARGLAYSGYFRVLFPSFYLGEWDAVLDNAARMRDAWRAEDAPASGFMGSAAACAAGVLTIRGDQTGAEVWQRLSKEMTGGVPAPRRDTWSAICRACGALHRGDAETAVEVLDGVPGRATDYRIRWAVRRAEAGVLAGRGDASDRIEEARAILDGDRFSAAVLARAEAIRDRDAEAMSAVHARFRELGTIYELARTGWLLGGDARAEARELFARLRCPDPLG